MPARQCKSKAVNAKPLLAILLAITERVMKMKDDKDIIIDGLMARIRELEKELTQKRAPSSNIYDTKTLFDNGYSELTGLDDIFYYDIDALELNVRTRNNLHEYDVTSIGKLTSCADMDILRIPNLGKKSIREISDVLSALGLKLGMTNSEKMSYKPSLDNPLYQAITAK